MPVSRPLVQFLVVFCWVTAAITAVGALLGAAIWPLVGLCAGTPKPFGQLALSGLRDLGFYFFIWAPGTAIVVATIREHRRRHPHAG